MAKTTRKGKATGTVKPMKAPAPRHSANAPLQLCEGKPPAKRKWKGKGVSIIKKATRRHTGPVNSIKKRAKGWQPKRNNHHIVKEIIPKKLCSECGSKEPRYKCPSCLTAKYCSVPCYKEHKSHCVKLSSEETPADPPADLNYVRNAFEYEFPPSDVVPLDKLETMKNDERISELLRSAKLRSWIRKMDETPSPWLFKDAMKDREFRAFSNVILQIAGVADEYNLE